MRLDAPTRRYLRAVVTRLEGLRVPRTLGVYANGSLAFGDFDARRSDIDMIAVTNTPVEPGVASDLIERLRHERLPCPAVGLDLTVFAQSEVCTPSARPTCELTVSTGATWKTRATYRETTADWLVDLSICRNRGRILSGPPAHELIGGIPRDRLVPLVANVVPWHRTRIHDPYHDPTGAFAVLNACRAWRYVADDQMDSKSAGGRWVLAREPTLSIVREALEIRDSGSSAKLDRNAVLRFLDRVENALSVVNAGPGRVGAKASRTG